MGQLPDVDRALSPVPRASGDRLVLLGATREELGGSERARCGGLSLPGVPRTDPEHNAARYRAFTRARDAGLVRSALAVGRGGLGVALAHTLMAAELSVEAHLPEDGLDAWAALWSESTGRLLVTVRDPDLPALREGLGAAELCVLGRVAQAPEPRLRVWHGEALVVDEGLAAVRGRFFAGLADD